MSPKWLAVLAMLVFGSFLLWKLWREHEWWHGREFGFQVMTPEELFKACHTTDG